MAVVGNLYKVAVIGDELLTRGMKLSGIRRIYSVETTEEVENAIKDATSKEDIGMIVINERLARKVRDRKLSNMIDSSIAPLFVLVPAHNEQEQYTDALRRLIIRAVGIDISAKR
jgi:vacuolar-type H+-ATPase subunit F/Vma7